VVLRETSRVQIGRYVCPPDSDFWRRENRIGPWPLFVFPRVPVGIRQAGVDGVVADPAAVMYYNSGCVYRRELLSGRGDCCDVFAIEPAFAARLAGSCGLPSDDGRPFPGPRSVCPADAAVLQRRLRGALDELDELALEEAVVGLCTSVFGALGTLHRDRRQGAGSSRAHADLAEAVRVVLAARYRDDLSLGELADEVEASEYHLCRVFRARCGETIHAYRTRLRMAEAIGRLLEGDEPLVDIALGLGFSSQAHFTSSFSRVFGVSPGRFRRTRGAG